MCGRKCVWLVVALAVFAWTDAVQAGLIDVTVAPQLSALTGSQTDVLIGSTVTVSGNLSSGTGADLVDKLAADNTVDAPILWDYTGLVLSFSGFDSDFTTVRFFGVAGDSGRPMVDIALRSSTTSKTSTTAADYETDLGTSSAAGRTYLPYISGVSANDRGYFDVTVAAPANTKSLYIQFAPGGGAGGGGRCYEVEAIKTVPEPSAITLLAIGLIGLLAYAWRKRR
jgi:hypothetical protein